MMRKILGTLSLLFGLAVSGAIIWGAMPHLYLRFMGSETAGKIVKAEPAGRQSISQSKYNNLSSSLPRSVETYRLVARFNSAHGQFETDTRLTYYQIDDIVGGTFKVKPITGQSVGVLYLEDDPTINTVDHPLPWNEFWYPLIGGMVFVLLGAIVLWVPPPKRRANHPTD